MIVWGGYDDVMGVSLNDGGRYDPATDSWRPTSLTNAPAVRTFHTVVWTGTEMIVWGGFDLGNVMAYNTGGRYDPATDIWTQTSTTNAPTPRDSHSAVWTGSEMIIWSGYDNTGARYDPATDSWNAINTKTAPSARNFHTAIWTGSKMIVWGGEFFDGQQLFFNTGGRYDPAADTWSPTDTSSAPSARYLHTAVWTGSEMIVWGGANDAVGIFNTGGRYDPATDGWTPTATTNAALHAKEARRPSWLSVSRR
jgi:N-acetylneuraminic acid mutarotase